MQPPFVTQTDQPLYPDLLYNRPVTRSGGGRLLVVGGYATEFSLPTAIHQLSLAAGVGDCRVVLPDILAKFLGGAPGTAFAPSSPSGSLAPEALGRILELAEETDAVAIGASLSNNSATAILIEKLIGELSLMRQPTIVFADALPILQHNPRLITDNPNLLAILTMAEIFKLSGQLQIPIHIRPGGGLINKLEIIQNLAAASHCTYAVYGTEIVIAGPQVSSPPSADAITPASDPRQTPTRPTPQLVVTPVNYRLALVPAVFYATLGIFWLQNRQQRLASLVTGAYIIRQASLQVASTDRPSTGDLAQALSQTLRHDDF